jgi:PAS domain S-box-containing protein
MPSPEVNSPGDAPNAVTNTDALTGALGGRLLASLLDGASEAVILYDADFRFLYLNAEAERQVGSPLAWLRGRVLWEVFPETVPAFFDPLSRAMQERVPLTFESRYAPNGRWSEGRCVPVELPSAGTMTPALAVFFRDVTDRHEAERARAAAREAQSILNHVTDAFVSLDRDGDFVYANPEAARLTGEPAERLVGQNHWEMYPHLRGTVIEDEYRRAVREQVPVHLQHHFAEADVWLDIHAYPAPDEGLYVVFRDITKEKKAEEELARREAEYAALVENAPDILTRFGPDLRVRYVSRAVERYMGVPREKLIGKTVGEMAGVPDENSERWEGALRRAFATGEPQQVAFEFPAPETGQGADARALPRALHFDASLTPEVDAAGRVVSVITVTHDTTARAEGERALREAASKQRRFLREMLAGFTEGRLRLCFSEGELPAPLPPLSEPLELSENSLRLLRRRLGAVAGGQNLQEGRLQGFATAVHEAAVNAVKYGGGGTARVHGDPEAGTVQVWVEDQGPGIAEEMIHRAVEQGYTTAGFGHGMFFMQSCADRLFLLSESGRGTVVVLEVDREAPEPAWLRPDG